MTMPLIEFHGEERSGRFRSAIGDKWVVGLLFEIRIVQINIGDAMRLGRQHHHAPVIGK
ncbi:hypothetical protein D3C76_1466530 [compost metagenome]